MENETGPIRGFQGPDRWLSNFWPLPGGTTVEHLYQAAKTTDAAERSAVLAASTPGRAKKMGSRVVHLRPDWDEQKLLLMPRLQAYKYGFPPLRRKLLATGDRLVVESNTWHDNSWGSCTCDACGDQGANALGVTLMALRAALRAEDERTPRPLRALAQLRRAPLLPELPPLLP